VSQGCLCEYYGKKREIDRMPGNKGNKGVSRHFLGKSLGWNKFRAFGEKEIFHF
jgi:hypothetical protein